MDYSQIDKAPEEKARGITISTAVSTARGVGLLVVADGWVWVGSMSSMRRLRGIMRISIVPVTLIVSTDERNTSVRY